MANIDIDLFPLAESLQLQDLGSCIDLINSKREDQGSGEIGIYCFAMLTDLQFEHLEALPSNPEKLLLVSLNPATHSIIINACHQIEAKDIARMRSASVCTKAMPKLRAQMSIRQMFKWMDETQSTVVTNTLVLGDEPPVLFGFFRTIETIRDFSVQLTAISRANEALN